MSELTIFKNNRFGEVRVTKTDNGEPLFCLADVCKILDLQTNKVKERLNPKGWNTIPSPTNGGLQNIIFIDEPNFYKTVFQSRKPEAEQFTDWVTSEVLPSIRKHGAYMSESVLEKTLTDPDFLIQLATNLKEERRQKELFQMQSELQAKELKESAPKVQYFNDVLQSKSAYTTNQIAKEMGMSAITLNRKLNDMRIQYKQNGTWLLYEMHQSKGFTKTKTHTFTNSDGEIKTSMLTVWTEKGRLFIHSLFSGRDVKATFKRVYTKENAKQN